LRMPCNCAGDAEAGEGNSLGVQQGGGEWSAVVGEKDGKGNFNWVSIRRREKRIIGGQAHFKINSRGGRAY